MKAILGTLVLFCTYFTTGYADHATLSNLSRELTQTTYSLQTGARQVIGYYPTYRQRYAYEHIMFFARSALRFQQIVGSGINDHAHDCHYAYRQLERDAYYARQTFRDLFSPWVGNHEDTNDHSAYGRLERLLSTSEDLVRRIGPDLP